MIQGTLDEFLLAGEPAAKEGILPVLKSLGQGPCLSCRLGQINPDNSMLLWKGNPQAEIAVVANYPTGFDMSSKMAFADEYGAVLSRWLTMVGLNDSHVFATYVVQCRTPEKSTKGEVKARDPLQDEINACFPGHALRALKAMPNLKVVICCGLVAMKALLGGEPQAKSHEGTWFGTDHLPGVAVFGLPSPKDFDRETAVRKTGRLSQILGYFKTEFLGGPGVEPGKILRILKIREQERRDALK